MTRHAGFSLLELVVVIVIAGILAALAIPRLTDRESRAVWFQEEVRTSVRYAQRQAIAQRRCVFVRVFANQVDLFYGDTACAITGTPVLQAPTGSAYVVLAPDGVSITPPAPAQFSFNGLGQPSSAVTFSVGGMAINVEAQTGYVH